MILADELDGRFRGFGAAGGEVNAAASAKIWRGQLEKPRGEFFSRGGMKLRGVRECDLGGLLRHGAANLRDAVANADDGGLAGGIEEAGSVRGDEPRAFAAKDDGKGLA